MAVIAELVLAGIRRLVVQSKALAKDDLVNLGELDVAALDGWPS
jgi:hypothetical protein